MPRLEDSLAVRVEALLGDGLVAAQPARGGYSSAQRWLVRGRGGRTAFAKIGATPVSAMNLRREAAVYERLVLPCMPDVYGWDDGSPPILLLSDLSGNVWPPPWTAEKVDRVLQVIDSVHSASALLPQYAEVQDAFEDWWGRLAATPEPFLRLNVVPSEWFHRNVELLAASARTVSCAGSSVTHYDLRSDNFCFASTHTYLVDWSLACLGNAHLIVEADNEHALGRGMKAIGARLARAANRVFRRSGPVLADRYHVRVLKTPREVRNALAYVLLNARRHAAKAGRTISRAFGIDPASSGRWFDGWTQKRVITSDARAVAAPRTWLLSVGWRGRGLVSPDEIPGG